MPDMERLTDKFVVDTACTEEQRMHELGFISGKNEARVEIAIIIAASVIAGFFFYFFII